MGAAAGLSLGAHERHAQQLEDALDGAVLALATVQCDDDRVRPRGAQAAEQGGVGVPLVDGHTGITQRGGDPPARAQRDVPFVGEASGEHGDGEIGPGRVGHGGEP